MTLRRSINTEEYRKIEEINERKKRRNNTLKIISAVIFEILLIALYTSVPQNIPGAKDIKDTLLLFIVFPSIALLSIAIKFLIDEEVSNISSGFWSTSEKLTNGAKSIVLTMLTFMMIIFIALGGFFFIAIAIFLSPFFIFTGRR